MNKPTEQTPLQRLDQEQSNPFPTRAGMVLKRWGPALLLMAIIFAFSSLPSNEVPSLGLFDFLIKKLAHATGYALLALGYLHGLGGASRRVYLLAWLMAFLYAASDEFHQSFVAGRNGTIIDVGIDTFGAGVGLWLASLMRMKRK